MLEWALFALLAVAQAAGAECPLENEAIQDDRVTLFVGAACGGSMIEGATVSIITATGESVAVGTTNVAGAIDISAPALARAKTILICAEDYFCGAIDRRDLSAGMERLIVLAPWAAM